MSMTGLVPVSATFIKATSACCSGGARFYIRSICDLREARAWSGKRDSNPQPSAWKADALPIELFPLTLRSHQKFYELPPTARLIKFVVVGGGFEPPKAYADRFTVCSLWPLGNPTIFFWSWRWDLNPQPADYKSAALPIELRQLSGTKSISINISKSKSFIGFFSRCHPVALSRCLSLQDGRF